MKTFEIDTNGRTSGHNRNPILFWWNAQRTCNTDNDFIRYVAWWVTWSLVYKEDKIQHKKVQKWRINHREVVLHKKVNILMIIITFVYESNILFLYNDVVFVFYLKIMGIICIFFVFVCLSKQHTRQESTEVSRIVLFYIGFTYFCVPQDSPRSISCPLIAIICHFCPVLS